VPPAEPDLSRRANELAGAGHRRLHGIEAIPADGVVETGGVRGVGRGTGRVLAALRAPSTRVRSATFIQNNKD
jgi:hypothetical protein